MAGQRQIGRQNAGRRSLPRPTVRGKLLILAGLAGLGAWLRFGDIAVLQFSLFLAFVLLASFLAAIVNFHGLSLRRELPGQVFAGERFAVRLRLANAKTRLDSYCLELEDELLGNGGYLEARADSLVNSQTAGPLAAVEIPANSQAELSALTLFRKRGIHRSFRYRLASTFPFGLFRQSFEGVLDTELTVYPKPLFPPVLKHVFAAGLGSEDAPRQLSKDCLGEFKGLREFTSGDPLKLVHWPLSARFRQLVVKEFEPSTPEEIVLAFHSYQPPGSFVARSPERALQILAGFFLHLQRTGSEFDFIASFNDWENIRVSSDPAALEQALLTLAMARMHTVNDLTPLLELLDAMPEGSRRIIVLSNTPCEHWRRLLGRRDSMLCLDNRLRVRNAPNMLVEL